jgi:hypothetical protein
MTPKVSVRFLASLALLPLLTVPGDADLQRGDNSGDTTRTDPLGFFDAGGGLVGRRAGYALRK